MRRRDLLQVAGGGLFAGLSGCTSPLQLTPADRFKVHNDTDEMHVIAVTIEERSSSDILFQKTLRLEGGTDSSVFSVDGDGAYTVTITIDSEYRESFPWNGNSCPDIPFHIVIYGKTTIDRKSAACD